ncbi:MAG TPA: class I SAM-dependent methyltransferase [Thermoanaerobaculia bacterium]|nr:class I SAM-dependent methyltransferase [Thermoanaerobaculia bacterium]
MSSPGPDVFGALMLAQYAAGNHPVHGVVERDDHLVGVEDARNYFSEYPQWAATEHHALKLVRGRVLDMGCGAGRHALYLQQQGFAVTGLDASAGAIEVCRKRGLERTLRQSIDDLENIPAGSFDTVTMFYNNFGLLQSPRKARRILRQLRRITAPDGQIIAECFDPYAVTNPIQANYHAFNQGRGRWGGQQRLRLRFLNLVGRWFDYLLVSSEEMRTLLLHTQWTLDRVLEGKQGGYVAVIAKTSNEKHLA